MHIKVVSCANSTDFLQVKIDGNVVFKIRVGEFAFFPLYNALATQLNHMEGRHL